MKWQPDDCAAGDMVRVKIGSVYHYGIFVSEDEVIAFGLPPSPLFADRPERFTVCAIGADEFSCGGIIERAEFDRAEKKKKFSPEEITSRARARLGEEGYNIIHNNCEHFANECVFGEKRSLQEEAARRRWMSRPICDVYVSDISEEEGSHIYPPEREREISECRNAKVRAAKYSDWKLLALAASRSLGIDITGEKFEKSKYGRWSCGGFEFSLSHTERRVAVAVSNGRVGVDIEDLSDFARRRPDDAAEKIAKRFFTKGERASYRGDAESFLSVWTKKEAYYKYSGKGPFRPNATDTAKCGGETYLINDGDTVLSVCADNVGCLRVFRVKDGAALAADHRKID